MTEELLQRSVIQWMQIALHPNVIYFHPANGEWRSIITAKRLKGMGVLPGCSDVVVLYLGRALCLEIKLPDGRQSESQRVFEAKCGYQGVPYIICRSLDDAIEACRKFGVPMRDNTELARSAA